MEAADEETRPEGPPVLFTNSGHHEILAKWKYTTSLKRLAALPPKYNMPPGQNTSNEDYIMPTIA